MFKFIQYIMLYFLFVMILIFCRDYGVPPLANADHKEIFLALSGLFWGICGFIIYRMERNEKQPPTLARSILFLTFIVLLFHFVLKLQLFETVIYTLFAGGVAWGITYYGYNRPHWIAQFMMLFLSVMVIDKGFLSSLKLL